MKKRKPADYGNDRYAVRMTGSYLMEVKLKHELDLTVPDERADARRMAQRIIDFCDYYSQ